MSPERRGKFIVIYGANNLGKSVQTQLLVESLRQQGFKIQPLKYPIYDLEPTGPRINQALREGLAISDEELQREFAQNRRDFEPELKRILEEGAWVVAEDYKGTGIAWGVTHDIPLETMEEINQDLLEEDVTILLDGERFTSGRERGHRYEDGADWKKARRTHLELAKRYGWEIVNANQTKERVYQDILDIIRETILN